MLNQPYIFKKQIVAIVFFSLIFLILKCVNNNSIFIYPVFSYCIVIISITFVPCMRKNIQYSIFLHTILYYSALYLPLVVINIEIKNINNFTGISIGIIISLLLIFSNYKHNIKYISSQNYIIFNKINLNKLIYHIFTNVYSVVGEELFYRFFLIGFLYKTIGIFSVLLSTIVFVYSHFISRWSNVHFNLRSYIYHGITGISFGLIFFYTKSISGCIIAHLIFNSPEFIVIYKRYKNSKKESDMLFEDYD